MRRTDDGKGATREPETLLRFGSGHLHGRLRLPATSWNCHYDLDEQEG